MMRSTHSMSDWLCMPTRVSCCMSAGWPMTWAKAPGHPEVEAVLRLRAGRGSARSGIAEPISSASSMSSAAMRPVSYA